MSILNSNQIVLLFIRLIPIVTYTSAQSDVDDRSKMNEEHLGLGTMKKGFLKIAPCE